MGSLVCAVVCLVSCISMGMQSSKVRKLNERNDQAEEVMYDARVWQSLAQQSTMVKKMVLDGGSATSQPFIDLLNADEWAVVKKYVTLYEEAAQREHRDIARSVIARKDFTPNDRSVLLGAACTMDMPECTASLIGYAADYFSEFNNLKQVQFNADGVDSLRNVKGNIIDAMIKKNPRVLQLLFKELTSIKAKSFCEKDCVTQTAVLNAGRGTLTTVNIKGQDDRRLVVRTRDAAMFDLIDEKMLALDALFQIHFRLEDLEYLHFKISPDGSKIVFWVYDYQKNEMCVLDVNTLKMRYLHQNEDLEWNDYAFSRDGSQLFILYIDYESGSSFSIEKHTIATQEVEIVVDAAPVGECFYDMVVNPSGSVIAVTAVDEEGQDLCTIFDLESGTKHYCNVADQDADIYNIAFGDDRTLFVMSDLGVHKLDLSTLQGNSSLTSQNVIRKHLRTVDANSCHSMFVCKDHLVMVYADCVRMFNLKIGLLFKKNNKLAELLTTSCDNDFMIVDRISMQTHPKLNYWNLQSLIDFESLVHSLSIEQFSLIIKINQAHTNNQKYFIAHEHVKELYESIDEPIKRFLANKVKIHDRLYKRSI